MGIRLSDLEIMELVAVGGMAEVYRARHTQPDGSTRILAVKKILPQYTQEPDLVAMFQNEAHLASLLHHPNIVRVLDLLTDEDGDWFIVMEFADGRDLADVIHAVSTRGVKLPMALAIHVARETLKALDYAHHARGVDGKPLGLIHRDVSPHNVMVGFDGWVKLTDFGVAKAAALGGQRTAAGVVKGKFGYMSPEQARGKPLDARSDIYNVGILLYEMLTAERLFEGANDISTLDRMRKAEVPPLAVELGCPEDLEAVVRGSLNENPDKRPPDARALDGLLNEVALRYRLIANQADVARLMKELFGASRWKDAPERTPRRGRHSGEGEAVSSVILARRVPDTDEPDPTRLDGPVDFESERTLANTVEATRTIVGAGPDARAPTRVDEPVDFESDRTLANTVETTRRMEPDGPDPTRLDGNPLADVESERTLANPTAITRGLPDAADPTRLEAVPDPSSAALVDRHALDADTPDPTRVDPGFDRPALERRPVLDEDTPDPTRADPAFPSPPTVVDRDGPDPDAPDPTRVDPGAAPGPHGRTPPSTTRHTVEGNRSGDTREEDSPVPRVRAANRSTSATEPPNPRPLVEPTPSMPRGVAVEPGATSGNRKNPLARKGSSSDLPREPRSPTPRIAPAKDERPAEASGVFTDSLPDLAHTKEEPLPDNLPRVTASPRSPTPRASKAVPAKPVKGSLEGTPAVNPDPAEGSPHSRRRAADRVEPAPPEEGERRLRHAAPVARKPDPSPLLDDDDEVDPGAITGKVLPPGPLSRSPLADDDEDEPLVPPPPARPTPPPVVKPDDGDARPPPAPRPPLRELLRQARPPRGVWMAAAALCVISAAVTWWMAPVLLPGADPDALGQPTTTVCLRSSPPGANVVLDGIPVLGATPVTPDRLVGAGPHRVLAVLGTTVKDVTFNVAPRQRGAHVLIAMEPDGVVEVRGRLAGAQVLVDGRKAGSPPLKLTALGREVPRHLRVTMGGATLMEELLKPDRPASVVIEAGGDVTGSPGSVVIWSSPSAWMEVGGRDLGRFTGGQPLKLPVGRQKVTLRVPHLGLEREVAVDVSAALKPRRYFFDLYR